MSNPDFNPDRKWQITLTERQLFAVMNAVEDIHRFLSGQTDLQHTTAFIKDVDAYRHVRDLLDRIHPYITPELPPNAAYGWNGGGCPDKAQREMIALLYAFYREVQHQTTLFFGHKNVYSSPTLTCGMPLPEVRPIEE